MPFCALCRALSTVPRRARCSLRIRTGSRFLYRRRIPMLKKLLAILVASTFAFSAFAQAPTPSTPSSTETKKDQAKPAKKAKGEKKAKAKGKGKAKSDKKADETKK